MILFSLASAPLFLCLKGSPFSFVFLIRRMLQPTSPCTLCLQPGPLFPHLIDVESLPCCSYFKALLIRLDSLVGKMLLTHFVRWILSLLSSPQSLESPIVIKTVSLSPTPGVELVVDPQDQWVSSRIEEETTCALGDHPQSHIVMLDMLQLFPGTWKSSRVNKGLRIDETPISLFAKSQI